MSKSSRFLFFSFIISLFFPLILSVIFFFNLLEFQNFKSLIIGWGIVFIGFVTELFFVKRGIGKSDKLFIRNVLGANLNQVISNTATGYNRPFFLGFKSE